MQRLAHQILNYIHREKVTKIRIFYKACKIGLFESIWKRKVSATPIFGSNFAICLHFLLTLLEPWLRGTKRDFRVVVDCAFPHPRGSPTSNGQARTTLNPRSAGSRIIDQRFVRSCFYCCGVDQAPLTTSSRGAIYLFHLCHHWDKE